MKGINILLLATGVHKVIDSRYKRFETMWNNSYKRAFYAQRISSLLKKPKISDFAYLSALLADIGSIVMLAINQDLMTKLRDIAGNKGIEDPDLLEEISLGLSHSTLGGMICRKWKFNEALVKTIEYHHRPHMAPENLRDIIYTVYLADAFGDIERNKTRFEIIDEDVLRHFGVEDKKAFVELHESLKENYATQQSVQKSATQAR